MHVDVDNHIKIRPPVGQEPRYWVLAYAEAGKLSVVIGDAVRMVQESYAERPEDVLTVFTSTDAATLYIAALGQQIGAVHNDNFRVVSMTEERFMTFLAELDRSYLARQDAWLRVDLCELRGRDLRREIFFSRQVPKH